MITAAGLDRGITARARFHLPRFLAAARPEPDRHEAWARLLASTEAEPGAGPQGALTVPPDRGYGTDRRIEPRVPRRPSQEAAVAVRLRPLGCCALRPGAPCAGAAPARGLGMNPSFRRAMLVALLAPSLASAQPPHTPGQGRGQAQGQGQGQGQVQPAPGQGQRPGSSQGQSQAHGRPGQVTVAFSAAEQARITAWLATNAASLKPLPPGIARNLARGKPLPPGIARRAAPASLLSQLVPRPGYEVLVVGTTVVLAQAGSLIVHDLVHSALR